MADFTNVTIFDKPYSAEKMAEGRAVSLAVVSGACNRCKYRRECENNGKLIFPSEAWCMEEKAKILEGMR